MSTVLELNIDPKAIPIRNVWHLLLYAWGQAQWLGKTSSQSESAPNLLGLFASILVDSTNQLLRWQLGRIITRQEREIRGVRGKIDFAASLKSLSFENGKAFCQFLEPTIDTPRNRIIRSTLARLARDQRISVGASLEAGKTLRRDLLRTVRAMEGVQMIPLQSSDFTRLQLGRNDRDYQLPLAICALVHHLKMPIGANGDQVIAGLLEDEMLFSNVFEKAVRNFYRLHLPDCRVKSEQLSWPDEMNSLFAPVMITDTSIETRTSPVMRMIIDTKYYRSHLAKRYQGLSKFHSGNLYQIYSYLRTQEDKSPAHRQAEGVLLYPGTGSRFSETMLVQGHRIQVRTVDLTTPWLEIEAGLMELVREFTSN